MISLRISSMKPSRRYLAGTLLAIYAGIFLFIGVNRATEHMGYFPDPEPVRITPAELAALTDFNRIEARGDFDLVVRHGAGYAVAYTPPAGPPGAINAEVVNGRLTVQGWGNRREAGNGKISITLPELTSLATDFNPSVRVDGFHQDRMHLNLYQHNSVVLADNSAATLELEVCLVHELSMNGTRSDSEHMSVCRQTTINR